MTNAPPHPTVSDPSPSVPAASVRVFDQLGKILLGSSDGRTLRRVLQRVAEAAQHLVPELDEVSVTLVERDQPHTAVFTGELASYLDERQYELGASPCADAALSGGTIIVATADPLASAYPHFAQIAAGHGITQTLSVGLPAPQRTVGALNMYSSAAHAFTPESVGLAEAFAGYAGVAVANAALYQSAAQEARHMHQALKTRARIEQARGILMANHRCSADEAFLLLIRASQLQNRTLHDVAVELVEQTQA